MTVAEVVKRKIEALAPEQQQEVLQFVESITSRQAKGQDKPNLQSLREALAEAAGIWKDRTDLPEDSAQAAQILRERAMKRDIQ